MQDIQFENNTLSSKCFDIQESSKYALSDIFQKNLVHGIRNARSILSGLEVSLEKSSCYEERLVRCRASHPHHHCEWPWELAASGVRPDSKKSSQQQNPTINLLESWSTMSIVCLQYQYEELSKRYEALLEAFNDKCSVVDANKLTIRRLRQRARALHARLASAHANLLRVGEKYLALKKRSHDQLQQYDRKIEHLQRRARDLVTTAESARHQLDRKLSQCMFLERDSEYAMLLAEMKKCNQLHMENLKLKAQLEECLPGSVHWTK